MSSNAPARPDGALYPQRRRELLRGLLLDGARDRLLEQNWVDVSMREVAAAAGVHRTSLYTEFGTRERLVRVLTAREIDGTVDEIVLALRAAADSPPHAVSAAVKGFLARCVENGMLAALLRRKSPELTALFEARRPAALDRLAEGVLMVWPALGSAESMRVADWLFRLLLSVAFLPSRSPEQTAAHIGAVLGTYVSSVVASPQGAPAQRHSPR